MFVVDKKQSFGGEQMVTGQSLAALTIRKHTGMPVLQHPVELLSKLLVARVAKQVVLPAFGMKMLQKQLAF